MTEIIAEIGINHDGDLDTAKKLIDIAYSAGCDYVKFQKRTINLVYSEEELTKPRDSKWGTTTKEQKEGLEFNEYQYLEIDEYCKGKIQWFASPWDILSMHMLSEFSVPFIKIASAMITNEDLIAAKSPTQPFIISTGGSTLDQVDRAIQIIGQDKIYCIMHCTATYPTAPKEINALCIYTLKERYPWTKIGFSNHYPGLKAMEIAVAYGAEMIEFHLTHDRAAVGSDHAASIEPRGAFELVKSVRLIEQMRGDGCNEVYKSEIPIMEKLR